MIVVDGELGMERMPDEQESWRQMSLWLQDDRVLKYYGGRSHRLSTEGVEHKYRPRVVCCVDGMTPAFLVLSGQRIGYVQYYHVSHPEEYQMRGHNFDGLWAMDLFIGEPALWGRGYGKRIVRMILDHLFDVEHAQEVWIDPLVTNTRAIHVYERCGFYKHKVLRAHEEHDGVMCDAWLMRHAASARPLSHM